MTMFRQSLAILALAGALPIQAEEPVRFDHVVRNDFFAGFAGNRAALDRALKITAEVLKNEPNHAEALVWHGSGTYYLSGQAFQAGDQQKGMELYQKGMADMDRAVELAPKSIGVRIPRGGALLTSTLYMQPEMTKPLIEKALTDYEMALELQRTQLDAMPEHPKGELLMGLASGYQRLGKTGKAKELYEKVAAEMAGSVYGKKAAAWLETGKLGPREQMCLGCHAGNREKN